MQCCYGINISQSHTFIHTDEHTWSQNINAHLKGYKCNLFCVDLSNGQWWLMTMGKS